MNWHAIKMRKYLINPTMHTAKYCFLAAAFTGILVLTGLAGGQDRNPQGSMSGQPQNPDYDRQAPRGGDTEPSAAANASGGRDADYRSMKEQPKKQFQAARQAFQAGNHQEAAQQLRQGAEFMRNQVDPQDRSQQAERVRTEAREIEELASHIQAGHVQSADAMKPQFAQAYQSLANYQYQGARSHWQQSQRAGQQGQAATGRQSSPEDKRIGHYLSAAAENAQNFAEEAGEELGDAGQAALSGARKAGSALVEGTGWTTEQVGEGIKTFGNWMEGLGENMQQRSSPGSDPQTQ